MKLVNYQIYTVFWHWHQYSNGIGNSNFMRDLLYLIAVILIIGWLLGVFYFSAGAIIHVLLVLAVIAILFRVIRGDRI